MTTLKTLHETIALANREKHRMKAIQKNISRFGPNRLDSAFTKHTTIVDEVRELKYSLNLSGVDTLDIEKRSTRKFYSGSWSFPFRSAKIVFPDKIAEASFAATARELVAWSRGTLSHLESEKILGELLGNGDMNSQVREVFSKRAPEKPNFGLTFVDLETTHVHPAFGEIIEIGIVHVSKDGVVSTYEEQFGLENEDFLKSGGNIQTSIHGISSSDLVGKRTFRDAVDDLGKFFSRNSVLVAHNATFELTWLSHFIPDFWQKVDPKSSDHLMGFSSLMPVQDTRFLTALFGTLEKARLEDFVNEFGNDYINAHRALADSKMTYEAYSGLSSRMEIG